MRNGSVVIIVAVILAAVIGAVGVLGYQKFLAKSQANEQVTQSTNSTQQTQVSSSPSVNDETANWKVYSNKKLKFSIKYPPMWQVSEDIQESGSYVVLSKDKEFSEQLSIRVVGNISDSETAEKVICQGFCGEVQTFNDIKIGSTDGKKLSEPIVAVGVDYPFYVLRNTTLYIIIYHAASTSEQNEIFHNQIISTVKFD